MRSAGSSISMAPDRSSIAAASSARPVPARTVTMTLSRADCARVSLGGILGNTVVRSSHRSGRRLRPLPQRPLAPSRGDLRQ